METITHRIPAGIVRFGTFELNLADGELRKRGLRIALQEQPRRILLALLERPGDVVGREELCRRLWPHGTFVDFEHSLNAAVRRLRVALGDEAEVPRFVETVHKRGYRFLVLGSSVRDYAEYRGDRVGPASIATAPNSQRMQGCPQTIGVIARVLTDALPLQAEVAEEIAKAVVDALSTTRRASA
jgi:DNA-binding winged helix-turn-helix (wHTH) protein